MPRPAGKRGVFDGSVEACAVPFEADEAEDRSERGAGVLQQVLGAGDVDAQGRLLHPTRHVAAPSRHRFRQLLGDATGDARIRGRRVSHYPDDSVNGDMRVMCKRNRDIQQIANQVHHAGRPGLRKPWHTARNAVHLAGLHERRPVAASSASREPCGKERAKPREMGRHFLVRHVRGGGPHVLVERPAKVPLGVVERVDRRSRAIVLMTRKCTGCCPIAYLREV